ncbi:membrane dipeptidase [Microbacterium sp.]|uniref:dipeptidase n=1 Tax=Microbacterium sp. TaxID=51671 RepID=UPI0031FE6BB4|nr:membrane dipeptidase [Microbacterium sp.]
MDHVNWVLEEFFSDLAQTTGGHDSPMTTTAGGRQAGASLFRDSVVVDSSIAPTMDDAQIQRMAQSGVTAFNWTVCRPLADPIESLVQIASGVDFIRSRPDELVLVSTVDDIRTAKRDGRIGLILGPQNAALVEPDLDLVAVIRQLGVRILQLTYNERNAFGDGCTESADGGVSERGRELIAVVERNGLVLDLSHAAERTILDAASISTRPVIVSHANARSIFASPRNLTDEAIDAVAATGGVIGATLWSPMVGSANGLQPTLTDFVRHVEYLADRVGPAHVGIGSDHSEGYDRGQWESLFSRSGRYPSVAGQMGDWYGYDTRFVSDAGSCTDLEKVAGAIAEIGFTEVEMSGILGENFLRVFADVWGA